MKAVDLDLDETTRYLKITDLDNFFDVMIDKRGNTVYDLNKTLYIDVDPKLLPEFECTHEMHWTLISHKIYGTTRLAWLLWKLNRVDASTIFIAKQPGDKVKYLPKQYVDSIVGELNEFDE